MSIVGNDSDFGMWCDSYSFMSNKICSFTLETLSLRLKYQKDKQYICLFTESCSNEHNIISKELTNLPQQTSTQLHPPSKLGIRHPFESIFSTTKRPKQWIGWIFLDSIGIEGVQCVELQVVRCRGRGEGVSW